jgi:hypothetical protein
LAFYAALQNKPPNRYCLEQTDQGSGNARHGEIICSAAGFSSAFSRKEKGPRFQDGVEVNRQSAWSQTLFEKTNGLQCLPWTNVHGDKSLRVHHKCVAARAKVRFLRIRPLDAKSPRWTGFQANRTHSFYINTDMSYSASTTSKLLRSLKNKCALKVRNTNKSG